MNKLILSTFIMFFTFSVSYSQMTENGQTLYGYEWINYDQTYIKMTVEQDGVYRVGKDELVAAGLPSNNIGISELKLFHNGQLVPIFVSGNGLFQGGDFIEFYGKKNRGEIDRFLFENAEIEQFNPDYSMFSDKAHYYLTWSSEQNERQIKNVANDISNPPAPLPFYMYHESKIYTNLYWDSKVLDGYSFSSFSHLEGWGDGRKPASDIPIQVNNVYTGGPKATVGLRFGSTQQQTNQFEFIIDDVSILDTLVIQTKTLELTAQIDPSTFGNNVSIKLQDFNESNSRHAVSKAYVTYPKIFDAEGNGLLSFNAPANENRTYIELSNFDVVNGIPTIYDLTNDRQIFPIVESGTIKFSLPASATDMDIVIVNSANKKAIISTTKINFTNLVNDNTELIVLSHPRLYNATPNNVQAYIDYRQSEAGGAHKGKYYNILDLYDLFAYGIENHPLAIRNFAHFVKNNWPDAKAFFIIGKGIEYNFLRKDPPGVEEFHMIPTFGRPGSDNLLMASETSELPMFPIGRIPNTTPEEIKIYLDKVKEYEAAINGPSGIKENGWLHNVLHISGGIDVSQQQDLESRLEGMGSTIRSNDFGAFNVSAYSKNSTSSVVQSKSDLIVKDLQKGVSLVNFFGHSGATTLDFQIDNSDKWGNKGKYPIFSAMGCYAGQIHTEIYALSTRYNFEKDAGTVAFVAGSGPQYIQPLTSWGYGWYNGIGNLDYGKTLGESLLTALKAVNISSSGNESRRMLLQQQTLNGDPMLLLPGFKSADYTIDFESLVVNPRIVTSQTEEIELSFEILNLGRNLKDTSINVVIEQETPKGNRKVVAEFDVNITNAKTYVENKFPINPSKSLGKNKLFISIDRDNRIDESAIENGESNNMLVDCDGIEGYSFFVFQSRMFASHPKKYSIVNEPYPLLTGTSSNAFIKGQTYVMDIDTTEEFNSPLFERNRFSQFGSVVKWTPSLRLDEGRVYYWRVSTDSISPTEGYVWDTSSFIYLPQSTLGWNQSHYYQYLKSEENGIGIGRDSRKFEFGRELFDITIKNNVYDGADLPRFFINTKAQQAFWPWAIPQGISVAVSDGFDITTWKNTGNQFNSEEQAGPRSFSYKTDNIQSRKDLLNFLENDIPDSNYVYLWTILRGDDLDLHGNEWAADSLDNGGVNIFNYLENQGATEVRGLEEQEALPYVIIYQKGVGIISEALAPDVNSAAYADVILSRFRQNGSIVSTEVGPSKNWESASWSYSNFQSIDDSYAYLKVYALSASKTDTLVVADSLVGPFLNLAGLNASDYPYLRLEMFSNNKGRLAPQLDYWRVNYTPYPDLIVNPIINFKFEKDTLSLGQDMLISTAIENVGKTDMANNFLQYTISGDKHQPVSEKIEVPALKAGESVIISYTKSVTDMQGNNVLVMQVNPDILPEEDQGNNFGILNFFVQADEINPLLNVTFDNRYIQNFDIVSAKPEIVIKVKDDNEYIPITNPENVEIFLKFPSDFDPVQISLQSENVIVIPADVSQGRNEMVIEFRPDLFEEGLYEFIVQAKDENGNASGDVAYSIIFEVTQEQRISNFYNFPNPFSDRTRFMYTLTGSELPTEFAIMVYNAQGAFVREITAEDLGGLKIGTNMTDVAWDATDQFGKQLAQGIYFFKVVAKKADGSEYKKLKSGLNPLFQNEVGKMILIR